MIPVAAKTFGALLGAVLAAAGLPMMPVALTSEAVVSSSHRGAILDLATDDRRGLIFSAGDDGTLRVWDTAAQTLLHRIAVTRQRAQSIALSPASPLAAILSTDGARAFSVDVWDWSRETLLYRVPVETAPFFVRFSLNGKYLLCGAMTWDSLHAYRARDGSPVPLPPGGGMVGYAEISRSDATLMTYKPSGTIEYRDIASGATIRRVETAADLVGVRACDNLRMLVGRGDSEIVGVDAVTGGTLLRIPAPGLLSMDVSADADRVAWITTDGALHLWSASRGAIDSRPASEQLGWRPRIVRFVQDGLFFSGDDGQIAEISAAGAPSVFASDLMAKTSGFAEGGGMLALAAGGVIHVFHVQPALSELRTMPSPYAGPVGLAFLDEQRLLAWRLADGPGALGVMNVNDGSFAGLPLTFRDPLAAVVVQAGSIYTLEKTGRILVVAQASGRQVFETKWPGAVCLAPAGAHGVVVGQSGEGGLQSSMVHIDLRTGETFPLPGTETYTYALVSDPADGTLYSLGVGSDGRTRLCRRQGAGLETITVLDSTEGEDTAASMSLDSASGTLFFSLGRENIGAWSGGSLRRTGDPSPGTQALLAREGLVCALQRDSTVSLWDSAGDHSRGTIYPFSDGSWAAIMADGSIQGAPAGVAKVGMFAQGRLVEKAGSSPQEAPVDP